MKKYTIYLFQSNNNRPTTHYEVEGNVHDVNASLLRFLPSFEFAMIEWITEEPWGLEIYHAVATYEDGEINITLDY